MNLARQEFHKKAHYYLALAITFSLPVARLTPIFISLMLLNWLVEGDFKNKFQSVFKNKLSLVFILFYVSHITGLIYTENMDAGVFDLQVKLSILLFPLIFVSRPIDSDKLKNIFYSLIGGCILAAFIMLSRATFTYITLGEKNFFYEPFSSFLIHPSYISMYMNVAIAWLLLNLKVSQFSTTKKINFISFLIILFFSVLIVLLSSKIGLLAMILMYIDFLIYVVISKKKYLIGVIGLFTIAVSVFVVMNFIPSLSGRINRAIEAVTSSKKDNTEKESTAVRMLVWKAAGQVISENKLFGVGTGDAKAELVKEYEKEGMVAAFEHKYNAHNQFYQVFVSLGVIGFIVFLATLLLPIFLAFKTNNTIYFLFLIIIILNFLPESMLEVQAGSMFYAFFNSLLCFLNRVPKNNNEQLTPSNL